MNQALQVNELHENDTELDSDKDTSVSKHATNVADADAIRAKIKAARLEKLIARQLENELSFELSSEGDTPIMEETPQLIEEEAKTYTEELPSPPLDVAVEPKTANVKKRSFSGGSSKRVRNLQTSRNSCDEMMARLRSGSDMLSGLHEQTSSLSKHLQLMEQEFEKFEGVENRAAHLEADYKKVSDDYKESLNLVKKQSRQIEVLETLRNNGVTNYENTKNELEKLQRLYQKQADELAESQMVNSEIEQDNHSLTSKLETVEGTLKTTVNELQKTSSSLKQKDMEAARTAAELISNKEKLQNAETSLGKMSAELEALSIDFNNKDMELGKSQSEVNNLGEKLKTSEKALARTTLDLKALSEEVSEKDMIHAKATSELSALIKSNSKTSSELESLQEKYDNLNKQTLEQQSQQYARINELETSLRDTRRQLEMKNQEKAELAVELEATNNLLVLHEEMVAALSPEENR